MRLLGARGKLQATVPFPTRRERCPRLYLLV